MAERKATVSRDTLETQITVSINLDGTGVSRFETGVPFLDHMMDQIARHGLIDLDIHAKGDLHIDAHHTVEDIGITLGQAFAQAVGDKKGIVRYGHSYVPLDEALSRVVIDFSGRPGLEWHVPFTRASVGGFDVDLFVGVRCAWRWPLMKEWEMSPRQPRVFCKREEQLWLNPQLPLLIMAWVICIQWPVRWSMWVRI